MDIKDVVHTNRIKTQAIPGFAFLAIMTFGSPCIFVTVTWPDVVWLLII